MITVENKLGKTSILLNKVRLEENIEKPRIYGNISYIWFYICTANKSYSYVTATGQSAEVDISNIELDGVFSILGESVFYLVQTDYCFLSIKDSSFPTVSKIVSVVARNPTVTIQNSTFFNTSTPSYGSAVYINSYVQSEHPLRNSVLHIINPSFSYSRSDYSGGAVYVTAKNLSAVIHDSSFLRCSAPSSGGAIS